MKRRSDNGKQSDCIVVSFCCIVRLPAARANNTVIIGVVMTSRLVSEGDLWCPPCPRVEDQGCLLGVFGGCLLGVRAVHFRDRKR
jgi:hypothetical protein